MKQGIHPTWNHQAVVTCACGATFTTGSSQDTIQVDICSSCHPFFTGEMKFVDRQGRVDRFLNKVNAAQAKQAAQKAKKKTAAPAPVEVDEKGDPLSYKQLLQREQQKLKNIAQNRAN